MCKQGCKFSTNSLVNQALCSHADNSTTASITHTSRYGAGNANSRGRGQLDFERKCSEENARFEARIESIKGARAQAMKRSQRRHERHRTPSAESVGRARRRRQFSGSSRRAGVRCECQVHFLNGRATRRSTVATTSCACGSVIFSRRAAYGVGRSAPEWHTRHMTVKATTNARESPVTRAGAASR